MFEIIVPSIIAIFVYMVLFYILSLILKDAGIVDIAWGLGFVIVAFVSLYFATDLTWIQLVVCGLVTIWGVRLASYIFIRKQKSKKEDWRYRAFRRAWGTKYVIRSFFQIFMLQGLLLLLIAYPIMHVSFFSQVEFLFLAVVGIGVWVVGFVVETVADYQKYVFKKERKNQKKFITTGLWKYSRHPNYFGEMLVWWGVFLIAASVQLGWVAILSPALITLFLLKVSGVTMLEKRYAGNKAYEQYKKKTNAFIPWFPK